ncbi:MAG: GNAT family N-acetyltransferase [Acidobacteria bacterium]|nr:GNAT family N-acetyltransferase [Acidobacteriota bacterium]
MAPELSAPQKLRPEHDATSFDSGESLLDDWLRRRALQNELTGASRTYVVRAGERIAGFYSLAVGALAHERAPGRVRRNMPDPIPVLILGRLAVDKSFQGNGLGKGLLLDSILRTLQAAELAGVRALIVHAISASAERFYEAHGFVASPIDPMTLVLRLADAGSGGTN